MKTRTRSSFVRHWMLAIVVPMLCSGTVASWGAENVFPAKEWETCTPTEAGMHAAQLNAIRELAGGQGCVVRGGKLVFTWGNPAKRGDVASACKPVLAHCLLKAIEEKKIANVDEAVIDFEPRLGELNAALGHKDRKITWRHLVNQTSCYGSQELPGTAFDYNDHNFALLFDTLFLKVYGTTWEKADRDVLRPLIADELGCQDQPTFLAFGLKNRPGRLAISVRDFARFGLLYLHDGNWNGRQLLRSDFVKMAIGSPLPNSIPRTAGRPAEMIADQRSGGGGGNQTDHQGSYSFMWWTNGVNRDGKRHWPDAPLDTFGAFGHGGPRALVVLPGLDVVIAWNDTKIQGNDAENAVLKLLVSACGEPVTDAQKSNSGNEGQKEIHPKTLGSLGSFGKWRSVDIQLIGPALQSRGTPNPFAIIVDGVFIAPSGKQWRVPGYFDGDGRSGPDGNVWRVRFSADEIGQWTFASESTEPRLAGWTATLTVAPAPADTQGLYRWGRLEAVGSAVNKLRYLKFRDGPFWLKAGCDDPENFLGKYKNYDTLEKRKGTIDYLAERGINSLYIMSHNIDGDDKDVWPWIGQTSQEAKANSFGQVRFDIARLGKWRELFEYLQQRGVVVYLVLEDDSAWKSYDHARYYREIVARFGDLPGLVFNLGEEHNENYKLTEGLSLARQLTDADPYRHPRGIHNINTPNNEYIDATQIDFTAIQTGAPGSRRSLEHALQHNQIAIDWIRRCESRGTRTLMINFDEGRPEERRAAWWAAYLAGGVWEAHVLPPYDRPISAWETVWHELGGARTFMESLPFWEMQTDNELVKSGQAFCLAKPGVAYALYMPTGGEVTIELPGEGEYQFDWWNPSNGVRGKFEKAGRTGTGRRTFTSPSSSDWALRIMKLKPSPWTNAR